jgi:hypothetical protein
MTADHPDEQPQASGLTPDRIKKLFKANLANITKKVVRGQTLSRQELLILEEAQRDGGGGGDAGAKPNEPTFAKNQVELARFLGVDRKTVQRWVKEDDAPIPRPNGQYHIGDWRAWATERGRKPSDNTPSQTALKASNLLLQNRKLEIQLKILAKEYVPVADVKTLGARLGSAVRKVVTSLHRMAPEIAGMNVQEAEALLKQKEDEIMEQFQMIDAGVEELKAVDGAEVATPNGSGE